MIDLCSDSEESCTVQDARPENGTVQDARPENGTVQDARPENDSNTSRKNQKRIERKHHHDLQDGFQSRLTSGYVNSGSGRIPFVGTTSPFAPAMTPPPIINIGNKSNPIINYGNGANIGNSSVRNDSSVTYTKTESGGAKRTKGANTNQYSRGTAHRSHVIKLIKGDDELYRLIQNVREGSALDKMLLQHQVAQVKNKKRSYAYTEKNDIVKAVKRVRNMELKYFNKMSVLGFALTSKVNQLE